MKKIFLKLRSQLNRWWLFKWWDKRCLQHDAARVEHVFGDPKNWARVTFPEPLRRDMELNTTDEYINIHDAV